MSAISQTPSDTRSNGNNSTVKDSKTDPIELKQQALIQSDCRWIKGLQAIFTEFNDATYFFDWVIRWDMTPHALPSKYIYKDQNGAISTLVRKNSY